MIRKDASQRRKSGLTPDLIIRTALTIIEDQGLSALSTRRLASALGCEAMSLYHHVPSMDALLDGVVDALLTGQRIDATGPVTARAGLKAGALAYLGIADRYPHAFQLVATRRWHTPNALLAARSMVEAFVALGFRAEQALGQSRILASYLNGAGLALAAWRKSDGKVMDGVADTLTAVRSEHLSADTVRADLYRGIDLMVDVLTTAPAG